MKNDMCYRLDYGQYDSSARLDSFCSTSCRFFSDCPGKGGFCSFMEQRELLPDLETVSILLLQESGEGGRYVQTISAPQPSTPFWRFPTGRGAAQPWRRRLWELKNKL